MYDQIYIQHMGRLLTTWKTDDQSTKTPLQGAVLGNMSALLTRNVYPNTRLIIWLHPLMLSLRDLKVLFYTDNLVFSSMNQTCQRSKTGSIPRDKLDVKSIWEAKTRGPDYIPAFYCSPAGIKQKVTFRFHNSIQDTDSNCYCEKFTCIL